MSTTPSIHRLSTIVALSSAVLALTACSRGSDEATSAATPGASTRPVAAAPAAPPPSYKVQAERALIEQFGAEPVDEGLRVTLSGVRFKPGGAGVEIEDTARIDKLAELVRERPTLQVRVIGHTDDRGSVATNTRLSKERAEAIRELLVKREIAPERIVAEGRGPREPVASNATDEGRARNRRVDVLLVDPYKRLESSRLARAEPGT